MTYVVYVLNHLSHEVLSNKTPIKVGLGVTLTFRLACSFAGMNRCFIVRAIPSLVFNSTVESASRMLSTNDGLQKTCKVDPESRIINSFKLESLSFTLVWTVFKTVAELDDLFVDSPAWAAG